MSPNIIPPPASDIRSFAWPMSVTLTLSVSGANTVPSGRDPTGLTAAKAAMVIPAACTLKRIVCSLANAVEAGDTVTCTVMVDGVASAAVATIPAAASSADQVASLALAAGDLVHLFWDSDPTGQAANEYRATLYFEVAA